MWGQATFIQLFMYTYTWIYIIKMHIFCQFYINMHSSSFSMCWTRLNGHTTYLFVCPGFFGGSIQSILSFLIHVSVKLLTQMMPLFFFFLFKISCLIAHSMLISYSVRLYWSTCWRLNDLSSKFNKSYIYRKLACLLFPGFSVFIAHVMVSMCLFLICLKMSNPIHYH